MRCCSKPGCFRSPAGSLQNPSLAPAPFPAAASRARWPCCPLWPLRERRATTLIQHQEEVQAYFISNTNTIGKPVEGSILLELIFAALAFSSTISQLSSSAVLGFRTSLVSLEAKAQVIVSVSPAVVMVQVPSGRKENCTSLKSCTKGSLVKSSSTPKALPTI